MQFIAEFGSNVFAEGRDNFLPRYEKMCRSAIRSGATDVKLQMFKADGLYADGYIPSMISEFELSRSVKTVKLLKQVAEDLGLAFLVSPFDVEAVDVLEEVYVYAYKIASGELSDIDSINPTLQAIAQTNKRVIMSTAAASMEEVWHNANVATSGDLSRLSLLHCTGGYPTPINESNLLRIVDLIAGIVSQQYKSDSVLDDDIVYPRAGFSCHVPVPEIAAASVFFQGSIIEAHFDLEDGRGVEAEHSFSPKSFARMVQLAHQFRSAIKCETCTNEPLSEAVARNNYRKNPEDWLRPLVRK